MCRIHLYDIFEDKILSRDKVRDFLYSDVVPEKGEIVFDFDRIEFVSRSAAHEIIIFKEKSSFSEKETKIISFAGMSPQIESMFRAVVTSIILPKKRTSEIIEVKMEDLFSVGTP